MATFDEFGRQIPVKGKIELPLRFLKKESHEEQLARLVRGEISKLAQEKGFETPLEADDFDIDDDEGDYVSPYEMTEMQEEVPIHSLPDKPGEKQPEPGDDKPARQEKSETEKEPDAPGKSPEDLKDAGAKD